jgi:hypothetical protein
VRSCQSRLAARIALWVFAVLAASGPAWAESTLVILVRPDINTPNATEVLNRARGELAADGFGVVLLDAVPEAEREATLLREGRARRAPVTAGVFIADDATSIELWLLDTVTGRLLVRRLEPEPGVPEQGPEVLARRSVDVLRASLFDFLVDSLREAASKGTVPVSSPPLPRRGTQPTLERWALEGGLGVLASFDGLGPAVLPVLRARFAPIPVVQLRVTGAWLGTQPSVETTTGTATVEQGIALAECAARPLRGPIVPVAVVGAGAYYVGVNGGADPASPYQGKRSATVAFALEAGVGVSVPIASRVEVVIEADALIADPGIAVRFLELDAAKIGRPSVLGTMTLAGWL